MNTHTLNTVGSKAGGRLITWKVVLMIQMANNVDLLGRRKRKQSISCYKTEYSSHYLIYGIRKWD